MRYAVSITFTRDTVDRLNIRTYLAIITAESEEWAFQTAIDRFEELYEGFHLLSKVALDIDEETHMDVEAEAPINILLEEYCDCPVDHGFFDENFELKCKHCKKIYINGKSPR